MAEQESCMKGEFAVHVGIDDARHGGILTVRQGALARGPPKKDTLLPAPPYTHRLVAHDGRIHREAVQLLLGVAGGAHLGTPSAALLAKQESRFARTLVFLFTLLGLPHSFASSSLIAAVWSLDLISDSFSVWKQQERLLHSTS